MHYRHLACIVSAAVALALPSEAVAQAARSASAQPAPQDSAQASARYRWKQTKSAAYKWEATYLALSAIDGIQTIDCLNRHVCSEGNPIWGKHPSTTKVALGKVGAGLVHFIAFKLIADRDPKTALRAAQVSAVVQGGVVLLNARWAF